jgi:hypothetical protein
MHEIRTNRVKRDSTGRARGLWATRRHCRGSRPPQRASVPPTLAARVAEFRSRSQRVFVRIATLVLLVGVCLARSPCVIGAQAAGTSGTPNAAAPRVTVSRQELRVVFPQDTATTWGWPERLEPRYHPGYVWSIFLDGVDGPRHLSISVGPNEPAARRFASLGSLVAAARSSFCPPDVIGSCPTHAASLSASDGHVVLSFRDSATIARVFMLRQNTVTVSRWTPSGSLPTQDTVRVEYIAPEIPVPNAATFAEAERARRAYNRSVRRIARYIYGGPHPFGPLLLGLGDSAVADVGELHCFHDVCYGPEFEGDISWSVDDTSMVRMRRVVRDSISPDSSITYIYLRPDWSVMVHGRRLGRTTVRAVLGPSGSDTLPSRVPPARSLTREVHVIPRVVRLELSAPSRMVRAGEEVALRVRALDQAGRQVAVPVDLLFVGEMGMTAETDGRVRHVFPNAGTATVIARFGGKADTLMLDVRPAAKPR